jgi:thioredoxin-related protein
MSRCIKWMAVLLIGWTMTAHAKTWEEDFEKASELAKKTGKYMLVDFSGSDWCGWCVKLDKEVFSKKEFKAFAEDNLVLVLLDFPQTKPQSTKLKKQNKELAKKYGVKGYPTVLIMDPEGNVVDVTGYQPGGPVPYIESIKKMIENHKAANKETTVE